MQGSLHFLKGLITVTLFLGWSRIDAQVYYTNSISGLYQITINGTSCSATFIGPFVNTVTGMQLGAGDIAMCPDGSLYITDNTNVYSVDPGTGASTPVAFGTGNPIIVGLVCNGSGLYGIGISPGGNSALYEVDLGNASINLLGVVPFPTSGDLVFFNGILYMGSPSGLIAVNIGDPPSSTVAYPAVGTGYVGMTVLGSQCNTLIGGSGTTLTIIDMVTGVESSFCNVPGISIGGLTSTSEFEPVSCEVTLDLDENDSSGATDANFSAPEYNCFNALTGVPIADIDVAIESPAVLSQITITIASGILNTGQEFLVLNGLFPGIQIAGSGTTTITLTNTAGAPISVFENALAAIRYRNTGNPLLAGDRNVTVMYSTINGLFSNTAIAFISVADLGQITVDLGEDILLCAGSSVTLDAGNPGSVYQWSNLATTQTTTVSGAGTYRVTVTNGQNCPGLDTIQVIAIPFFTVGLSGGATICQGQASTLTINTNATGLFDVEIQDDFGNTIQLTGISNGYSFTVSPTETTVYSIVAAGNGIIPNCFHIQSGGKQVIVKPLGYSFSEAAICNGDSIFLAGSWQFFPGEYINLYPGANGCDSIVYTTLSIFPLNINYLSATTCDSTQVGEFVQTLQSYHGCDSFLITTTTLVLPDTTTITVETCDPALAGIFTQIFQNGAGCDSLVIATVTLVAADTTTTFATTCNPASAGVFTQIFQNGSSCDSFVIATVTLLPVKTIMILDTTCNPILAGIFVETFTGQNGCDSIVTTEIRLLPADSCKGDRPNLYIPNVFSPDGAINNTFSAFSNDPMLKIRTFQVYDRWGETVFKMNNIYPNDSSVGWDGRVKGKPADIAVFVYYVIVEYEDGETELFEGDVLLLR